ncbi:MAG: flavodoxin family protein, partial [Candidatus Omnitrophica bacterium]|nr:flavodoxin family protein [Candidatus Omnitrophota bacterium]
MKILGISGSPRKGGNTDTLLDKALEGAQSAGARVEKIALNDLNFKPCQECGGCDETGICVIDDDMQLVYRSLNSADAVIVASPIFFGSVTAQVKMMIDRLQSLWVLKYVLRKAATARRKRKGIFLCVSAARKKRFFENAKSIIKIFFATLDIKYA